jgi:hypothetical protein
MKNLALHAQGIRLRSACFFMLCALTVWGAAVLGASEGYAQAKGVEANAKSCPSGQSATLGGGNIVSNCDCYDGLANRIVGCVRETIDNTAERFFNQRTGFYPIVKQAVFAFITFCVVIYGMMVAGGMVEKLGRDTMVLLLKLGFVVWGVENTDWIYSQVMQMIDALSVAMFQFNTLDNVPNNACPNKASVWMRIDCVVDTVIGIKISTQLGGNVTGAMVAGGANGWSQNLGNTSGLERGLIGTFFTMMKGSDVGFMTGIIGLIATWTMIMFLIKVLFAFLVAFIGLAFMIMLGPLFIPLVLFRATKTYFDKWVEFIITTSLQPVLLLTFVTFATAAMDLVIFSGERSVYRTIAGNAAQQPGFNMNKYLMGDPEADPNKPGLYKIKGFMKENSGNGLEVKGESSPLDYNQIRGSVHGPYTANISDCISRNIGTPVPRLNGTSTTPSAPGAAPPAAGAAPVPAAGATPAPSPAVGGLPLSNIGGTVNNLRDCSRTFIKSFVYREIDFQKLAIARNPAVNVQTQTGDTTVAEPEARQLRRELMASTFLAMVMMFLMNALMRIVPELTNDLTGSLTTTPNYFNLGGQWSAQQILAQQAGGAVRNAGSGGTR